MMKNIKYGKKKRMKFKSNAMRSVTRKIQIDTFVQCLLFGKYM